VEYRSRPISVSGAVKNPVTFQATGTVTLLDAIHKLEDWPTMPERKSWLASQSSATNDKSVNC
jgi:antibiotic biosynthesis monooxygenase (ABM) superfamily enzyme